MAVAAEQAKALLENPFVELGIAREALEGLTPEGARELAKVFYRHHANRLRPDLTENNPESLAEWRRIDRAFKQLDSPEKIRAAMRQYRPMAPEKEASAAERIKTRAEDEERRTRAAILDYLKEPNPIWTQGPATLVVVNLQRAFAYFADNEAAVLEAASVHDMNRIGAFIESVSMNGEGEIETPSGKSNVRALLVMDLLKDAPGDFLVRMRRAGLQLPDLSRLLTTTSGDSGTSGVSGTSGDAGNLDAQEQASLPTSRFNLHRIGKEQFAEFALYLRAQAVCTDSKNLSLLVSVDDSSGENLFRLEGILLAIQPGEQ